ncbi:MAG: hypothetical protein PF961_23845 [Planctomycetota bacterium]|nr:hypothetical protein [Planctomycetota bacterium]
MPPLFRNLAGSRSLAWHLRSYAAPAREVDWHQPGIWQPLPLTGVGHGLCPHVRVTGPLEQRDRPLLIWHHGAGEFPVDASLANALRCGGLDLPVAVIRATAHHRVRTYVQQLSSCDGAAALLGSSVAAIEAVRRQWPGPVLVAGLSLGGMVVAAHARRYGRHARATTRWACFIAGPDSYSALADSVFARLTDRRTRRDPGFAAKMSLASCPLDPAVARRVHPLLGQWDQVHRLRAQTAAWRAEGVRPRVAPRAHIGLAMSGPIIAAHLRAVIDALVTDTA